MSFRSMHDDYLDPDRHLGGGGAADSEAFERLVEAAPDMLAALQALADEYGPHTGRMRIDAPRRALWAAARAAIAKATGEQL